MKKFSFKVLKKDKFARLGLIDTHRGQIDTPAFMPVGTQGTVKGIFTDDIKKTNTQIILGNTYHLLLRPGIEILNKFEIFNKTLPGTPVHCILGAKKLAQKPGLKSGQKIVEKFPPLSSRTNFSDAKHQNPLIAPPAY